MLPLVLVAGGKSLRGATACMYSFADGYGVRYGAAPFSCKAVSNRVSIALASFCYGAHKSNRNAWKHGHYSAEAIATRQAIRELIGHSVELVEKV